MPNGVIPNVRSISDVRAHLASTEAATRAWTAGQERTNAALDKRIEHLENTVDAISKRIDKMILWVAVAAAGGGAAPKLVALLFGVG